MSKRPGTSNRIEIHFDVFNHLYLCFSFMKLADTLWLCLIKRIMNLSWIWEQSKVYLKRNLVVLIEKRISIWELVPVLFPVFRSPGCNMIVALCSCVFPSCITTNSPNKAYSSNVDLFMCQTKWHKVFVKVYMQPYWDSTYLRCFETKCNIFS